MTSFLKIKSLAAWVARMARALPLLGVALVFSVLMLQSPPGAAQVDSGFDHATTAFPLSGLHEQVRCESCHIKGIFKTTPRDCSGCHIQGNQRGAKAKPVNHIQSNDRCEECHTVVAFSVARFNHSTVVLGSCSICHDGRRTAGLSPNHIPTNNFACDQCHGTSSFKPVLRFEHSVLGEDMNTCAKCHDGIMAKGKPNNHVPRSPDALCATCHAASLVTYKSFAGGQMDHKASGLTTGCADCHGPGISAGTFAGISSIIAMPPTSPAGPNAHIPSSTTCESCHLASMPLTLVPANAVAGVPGSGFATPVPTGVQIHAGVTSGCSNCHETNFTWLGMSQYPISPATYIPKAQYKGFQVRPTAAGGQFAVADAAHPSTGDCADCHAGTTYFSGEVKPDNHIPTLANVSCTACHTSSDYAVLPSLANTHKYAPSTTGNCLLCHGNAALNSGQPASYYAIPAINFNIKALPDNHVPFKAGQECQVCHTSITTPVTDGATFANSKMVHAATNSACDVCHGSTVTGSTFAGVTKIVVLPPTSPAGVNSHMPLGSVTDCAKCHALTNAATALPGVATSTAAGSTGFYPGSVTSKPTSAQVHAGIAANNCNQCHADGMNWMSVTGPWPMTPSVLTAGVTAYKGFQTLPKAAGSATNINDALHPAASAGDCSACHTSTDAFTLSGLTPPTNHMPYAAAAACTACHKVADWATMPALTDIHANTTTASKCADCHAKAVANTFASSSAFVADGANHLPFTGDCAACHVGSNASIATLPVKNGAKFSGSGMAHAATTSACDVCHGAAVTATTFQGVTKIVVLPPTSPAGVNAHIPTTAACEQCHSTSALAVRVPGVATKTAPGTAFATPVPNTTQIHTGIGGNCVQCHNTNQIWMGMDRYPISPLTKSAVASTKYTGFHNRPGATGGAHTIADPNHPAGECADCHGSFDAWSGVDTPVNHIPFAATAQCSACHTSTNFSALPTVTNIHKNAQSMTGNCLQCHGSAAINGGKPASYFAIPKNAFSIKALPDNHLPYTTSQECMVCHTNLSTPVADGATFANSKMAHSATTASCATCHGSAVTGSTFAGVTKIIVLPATSPMGAGSHIPTAAACDQCHKLSGVPALVPGVATLSAGTGATLFGTSATVLPTSGMIHTGMTSGCMSCHEANYQWMGMSAYPVNTTTVNADPNFQYRGFQTRPTAAGGSNSVRDSAHATGTKASNDCQTCHSEALGFQYFGVALPANHIPYAAGVICGACHTGVDYAVVPTLTNIHKNAQSTTGNCLQCHGSATLNGGKPASFYAIPANGFNIVALPDKHVPYTSGQECQVCHTSITVPVTDGATFANSKMVHTATNSACDVCHGSTVTGSTFAGVTKIVVLPPTTPAGVNSHMPLGTVKACDSCHALTAPATAMAGVATTTTAGSTGFYPGSVTSKPTSTQVHAGITANNCNQCHADGMNWMSVTGPWPMTPSVLTAGTTAYKGFQTLPKATGTATNINDPYHPAASAGDCSVCHTGTDSFALVVPPKHMPYLSSAACATCHTAAAWSTMPALTPIHANTVAAATCASCHAKAVAGTFASSAAFMADGGNHIAFNSGVDCAACHVGTGSSIAALPVVNGAKFSGSAIAHTAVSTFTCVTCHGTGLSGSSFQGVTSLVVLPPTSPMGVSSHIPSAAACDQCHKLTGVPALVPGVATKVAGTGTTLFGTAAPVLPTSANIHAGMSGGCATCHEANYTWMGMSGYPVNTNTVNTTANFQYRGFQTRPTPAGGANSVLDPAHVGSAATNDCQTCHSEAMGFVYFSGEVKPANHIPYAAGAACNVCHTTANFATLPTVTNIHKYAQSTTGNCLQCHGNAALNSGQPASYYAIPAASFSIKALPDNHVPYTSGQECQVCHTSITTPVTTGATFANSKMVHTATNSACDVCHGSTVTASTFAGVTKIVVLPPTSPAGVNSHMPLGTVKACDSCHALSAPATAMAGVATTTTAGSTGFYPGSVTSKPTSTQVHAGITANNCNQCHADGMNWMSVTGPWPMTPSVLTAGTTAYKGFQTLPKATGTATNINDPYHPAASAGDCSVCHTGTDSFALVLPTTPKPHMPYKTGVACAVCHTAADWATMPALTPIHANTVTGATCASCHAKAVASSFLSSAAFVADAANHIAFNSGVDCAACHVGTGSSITALPVVNGAKFSGSAIAHTASSSISCATCHGSTVTSTTFQGISKIVVMPQSTTPGATAHIPSAAACDACHKNETPAGLVAGNAASITVPGTGFGTVTVLGTAIHTGITNGCSQCHDTGMVWLGVGKYTRTPTTITGATSATQYRGFNSRPTSAGSTYAIADPAHATGQAATADCSTCHSGTVYFSATATPSGHVKYTAGTACTVCHSKTAGDYSFAGLSTAAVIHAYYDTGSGAKCLSCHAPTAPKIAYCATQAACASPPPVTYQPTMLPTAALQGKNHIPIGSAECGAPCHTYTTSLWKGIATSMGGSGANATTSLNMHTLVYVTQNIPCKTCHESTLAANWYNFTIKVGGKPSHHGRTTTAEDCAASGCHSKTKFNTSLGNTAAALIRPVLRSAIVGSRPRLMPDGLVQPGADSAGNAVFDHKGVLPGDCASCHNGQMAKGLPVKHLVSKSSCDTCHRTSAWKPADFSHQGVPMGQCQVCHNGQNGPGKVGGHFVTSRSCDACHKVVGWLPVMYSHTSPLYVMQPDKTTCLSCHVTNGEIIPRQMRGGPRPRPQ